MFIYLPFLLMQLGFQMSGPKAKPHKLLSYLLGLCKETWTGPWGTGALPGLATLALGKLSQAVQGQGQLLGT